MNRNSELDILSIDRVFFEDENFCIECDDGWYEPIFDMAQKIKLLNKAGQSTGFKIMATQIKEKFGGLRVYYSILYRDDTIDDELLSTTVEAILNDVILAAETRCWNTCEVCGLVESEDNKILSTTGWIKRVCEKCFDNVSKQ